MSSKAGALTNQRAGAVRLMVRGHRRRRVTLTTNHVVKRRSGRRAPEEVKDLVLRAANRLFSAPGYHGTTTRQIADEAGVGESVLFRNFGTKADLFETTVLTPFTEFVDRWANTWNVSVAAASDPAEVTRAFVKGFYELGVEHRELFRTLIAARVNGGDKALTEAADRVIAKLAETMRAV